MDVGLARKLRDPLKVGAVREDFHGRSSKRSVILPAYSTATAKCKQFSEPRTLKTASRLREIRDG